MKYECPVCKGEMVVGDGDGVDPKNGVTIFCPHTGCPAQEVFGHGGNEKEAWQTIQLKYVKREDR